MRVQILGKRMNKTQQCSDWQMRPLSPQQVEYAALDALSLVQVFDAEEPSRDRVARLVINVEPSACPQPDGAEVCVRWRPLYAW